MHGVVVVRRKNACRPRVGSAERHCVDSMASGLGGRALGGPYPTLCNIGNNASAPEVGLRAGFRTDSTREIIKIGLLAGRRLAEGPMLRFSRLEFGRNLARKPDFRPGGTIA